MRQLKNCKAGHFVRYRGVVCQVNRFYRSGWSGERHVTLVPVHEPGEKVRLLTPPATEKAEYLGPVVKENGKTWVGVRRDPVEECEEHNRKLIQQ